MCHIYFPASFICVIRLWTHNINHYACNTSTQHVQPSKQTYVLLKSPSTPHFYRQMLALHGLFGRGAPQSPIGNSRHKKAATSWVCPWGRISQCALLRHQWRPLGAAKKCVGSLGDKMSARNSNKYNNASNSIHIYIYNQFAEMCHMYFPTSSICVLLIKRNINNYAYTTST